MAKVYPAPREGFGGADGKRLSPRTNTLLGAFAIVMGSGLLAAPAWAGDPVSDQVERARMQRKLVETPGVEPDHSPGTALPPARLEVERLEGEQRQGIVIDNDQRWRRLLGEQAGSRNAPSDDPGARPIRDLLDSRFEDAQELHRRIQRQDLEYRLQRDR